MLDGAVYEGTAEIADAIQFVAVSTPAVMLSRMVVVDVGYVANRG